jgi:hypothetical protein
MIVVAPISAGRKKMGWKRRREEGEKIQPREYRVRLENLTLV